MSVLLSITDFVPVAIFLASAIILQRDLYNKMSISLFSLFSTGSYMVFTAGFFKALWKLLYCTGVCDFEKLNHCFMPMQGIGFLLTAFALIAMLSGKKAPAAAFAVPAVYSGTMIFVSFMCLGIIAIGSCLSVLAAKLRKKSLIILFILAIFGMLAMGYLSSKDFSSVAVNWMAELVNIAAQSSLLVGVLKLHKAGLKELKL